MAKSESIWNRQFVHILLIEWCLQFGIYTTTPIASNYAVALGAGIGLAGLRAGLNSTCSLVLRPFLGWITDNLAKKSLLLLSGILFVLSGFGCALAPNVELMGFFRAVQGAAFAFKSVILISFASFVVPKSMVGSAAGTFTIGSTLASALAPTVGTEVGKAFGFSASFACAGAFFLCGLVLILFLKAPAEVLKVEEERVAKRAAMTPEERKFKFSFKDFFYIPAFIPSVLGGLTSLCYGIIATFLIMVSTERGIEGASVFFLAYSACAFFTKPAAGKLLDKKGYAFIMPPALVIQALCPIVLVFANNFIMIAIAGAIFGTGHAVAYSSSSAYAAKMGRENPEAAGRAMNTFYVVPDIGMGLGPMVGGFVYQLLGANAMFGFVLAVTIFDLVLSLVLKASKKI